MSTRAIYEALQREAEARHRTEAERVLDALRHFNQAARSHGSGVDLVEAWADSPMSVCAIYRIAGHDQRYGLRRRFPPHFTGSPESTGDSMQMDMEEPLGSARTVIDDDGVIWHGHLTEPPPRSR